MTSHPIRFLNPYVQILVSSSLVTVAEVFLKKGATETVLTHMQLSWLGISSLSSGWVWLGIACYITSFASWLYALRFLPLIIAFNLSTMVHVLVPISCWIVLGETISLQRWVGILLVLFGIWIIAKPLVKMEESL